MRLGNAESYIDIEVHEPVAPNMPGAGDLRLGVTVHGAGFTGDQQDVWVRGSAAERFINDLYAMARGERDDVTLGSPSSNKELTLKVSRPMRSHVVLEGKLRRTGPGSPATVSSSVVFSIYLDVKNLENLADIFADAWIAPEDEARKKH
ncbi:MAG: hypothetical protein PVH05_09230 [Burkholderiales bacterium]|jgi:hypothetical protein